MRPCSFSLILLNPQIQQPTFRNLSRVRDSDFEGGANCCEVTNAEYGERDEEEKGKDAGEDQEIKEGD